jgi:hypothetical protein
MITVSLSQIYDSISAHDNLDAKSVRGTASSFQVYSKIESRPNSKSKWLIVLI